MPIHVGAAISNFWVNLTKLNFVATFATTLDISWVGTLMFIALYVIKLVYIICLHTGTFIWHYKVLGFAQAL